MTIITGSTLYVVLLFITLLLLVLVIPMVIDHWTTKAKKGATDAERDFLERANLTVKEKKQFMEAESDNERLAVVVNIARLRGAYAPITLPGLTYAENLHELTRLIVNLKPYKGE